MSIPPLRVSADSSSYSAVYHLSEDARGSLAKQAMAMMLLKYFANTPGLVMEEARRSADGGGWGALGGVCAFDEMHAADIAERCERLKGSDVSIDLKSAMEWRGYNTVFVDVVIPNDNEVEDRDGTTQHLQLIQAWLLSSHYSHHLPHRENQRPSQQSQRQRKNQKTRTPHLAVQTSSKNSNQQNVIS
jgi:hypothetical protein